MFFRKEDNIFFEEKIILADTDPKQLLTVDFACFSYLGEALPIQGNVRYTRHLSGPNRLDIRKFEIFFFIRNNDFFWVFVLSQDIFDFATSPENFSGEQISRAL